MYIFPSHSTFMGRALLCALLVGSLLAAPVTTAAPLPDDATPAATDAVTLPVPLRDIAAVSAGGHHTCALTTAGGVKCWGYNDNGQLGNGSHDWSTTPVDVSGLAAGVVAVTAGGFHTCVLTTGGGVKCWGFNEDGELGNDSYAWSSTPVDVYGLTSGVVAMSAGGWHTCALTTGGGVKCWGDNSVGQLGNHSTTGSAIPVNVTGLTANVVAVSAGDFNTTCALITGGGVKCWGYNSVGQLGDGSTVEYSTSPVDVADLTNAVAVSVGGSHTCALTATGGVKCWGYNAEGQLGDGSFASTGAVVNVIGLTSGVAAVSAGGWHTCALTTGGSVKCWGRNKNGQIGDGDNLNHEVPRDVIDLAGGMSAIAAGLDHTCALTTGGGVNCWGSNASAQLGDTTMVDRSLAGDVVSLATCYTLGRTHTGSGSDPTTLPANTPGCPPGHYLPGATIVVAAWPNANRYVQSWSGTANNGLRDVVNDLRMPAADTTVGVTYGVCRALTCTCTGTGDAPLALPAQSPGCASGKYAAGERITLVAAPGANQRVQSWSHADQTPAAGVLVNTLAMPDADTTVTAAYEACFQLTATTSGQGDPIAASPVASDGCAPGMYVAGQSIVLSAAPAAGWAIAGWSGTANDTATTGTNTVTMPAAAKTVGIAYTETATPGLFLPSLGK